MYECTAVGRPLGGPSSFLQGHLVSALRLDRMARRTRGLSSGPPRRRCGHPPESPQTGAHTGASHPYLPTAVRRRPVQTSSAAALRRRGRASAARPAAPYARRASRLASPVLPGRDRRQQAASSAHSDGTHLAGRTAASSARQDRPRSSDACSAAPAGLAPRAGRAAPQCGASSARGEEAVARVRVPTSTCAGLGSALLATELEVHEPARVGLLERVVLALRAQVTPRSLEKPCVYRCVRGADQGEHEPSVSRSWIHSSSTSGSSR